MPSISPACMPKVVGTIKRPIVAIGSPHTISVCMIVKNEEGNIRRALESFAPFADEIILNDTGSTDRTVEIAKSFPKVKVIHSKWKNDFSHSRNISLKAATKAWIVWMDGDDFVPEDQAKYFISLKQAPLDRCFGFQIINTQAGQPVGTRFVQTRMFPNHPEIRFERKIHEQVNSSCARLGLHYFHVDTSIWHMGYENPQVNKEKSRRNIDLLIQETDRGIDPTVSMQLGDAYSILEEWPNAISAYKEALEIPNCELINRDLWKEIPCAIGRCLRSMGNNDEALEWFKKAEKLSPEKPEPKQFMGAIYYTKKEYDLAEQYFIAVRDLPMNISGTGSQYDVLCMYARKYLCDIYAIRQNWEECLKESKAFHNIYPQIFEPLLFIAKSLIHLNRFPEAIITLKNGIQKNPTASQEAWELLLYCAQIINNQDLEQFSKQALGKYFKQTESINERV